MPTGEEVRKDIKKITDDLAGRCNFLDTFLHMFELHNVDDIDLEINAIIRKLEDLRSKVKFYGKLKKKEPETV